jgi:methyltransferase (TIGR00027 family)
MAENQAGITALITAYARAYHATHDSALIFDDFLADELYTPEEHLQFDHHLAGLVQVIDPEFAATRPEPADALARVIQLHNGPVTLSRSRYCEACLMEAIAQGVEQYVILGAGFDTFALRHPELVDRLEVYEIDHPVTQAMKRERFQIPAWEIPPNLHLIPVDFAQESLGEALRRSSFEPLKTSFFSWLGVSYYLTREVVLETLRSAAGLAARGSTLVFDYLDEDAFIPEKAAPRTALMQRIAGQVGEPMKTGFDPAELRGILSTLGYDLAENLDPDEIDRRYFQGRTDLYRAFEHFHFARASIR